MAKQNATLSAKKSGDHSMVRIRLLGHVDMMPELRTGTAGLTPTFVLFLLKLRRPSGRSFCGLGHAWKRGTGSRSRCSLTTPSTVSRNRRIGRCQHLRIEKFEFKTLQVFGVGDHGDPDDSPAVDIAWPISHYGCIGPPSRRLKSSAS